jgi:hypothetical protein
MLHKVLKPNGACYHGGRGAWPLPTADKPGTWLPAVTGTLVPCTNGYHLATLEQLVPWLGPAIFEAEGSGDHVEDGDKSVWRQARLLRRLHWNEHSARLFACDCAEHVLRIYEDAFPGDDSPRQAIAVTRAYVNSQATTKDLQAAYAAAYSAHIAGGADAYAVRATIRIARAVDPYGVPAIALTTAYAANTHHAEQRWQADRLRHYLYEEITA